VIDHVVHLCLSAHVNCVKTADWIRMLFGVVSGVGLHGMGVLDFGGDRRRERGSLGVNLRRPIVNNEDCCVVVWKCVERSSCRLAW